VKFPTPIFIIASLMFISTTRRRNELEGAWYKIMRQKCRCDVHIGYSRWTNHYITEIFEVLDSPQIIQASCGTVPNRRPWQLPLTFFAAHLASLSLHFDLVPPHHILLHIRLLFTLFSLLLVCIYLVFLLLNS
jgi:hypothetical protein